METDLTHKERENSPPKKRLLTQTEDRRKKGAQYARTYYLKRKTQINARRQAKRRKERENVPSKKRLLTERENSPSKKRLLTQTEDRRIIYLLLFKRKTQINARRQAKRRKERENIPSKKRLLTQTEDRRKQRAQYARTYYLKNKTQINERRKRLLTQTEDRRKQRAQYARTYYLKNKTQINERRQDKRLKQGENSPAENLPMALQSMCEHYCGKLIHTCAFCNALHFYEEQIGTNGHFKQCCHNGKIMLSEERTIKETPTFLLKYFTENTNDAINFKENIRAFNSALAFASLKANTAPHIPGRGPYTFKIHGQMYHCVGSLYASPLETPCYGQMYILDSEEAFEQRMAKTENQRCSPEVMKNIQTFLIANNPYAKTFKTIAEIEKEQSALYEAKGVQVPNMKMVFTKGPDRKRFNTPTVNEIAAVLIGPDGEVPSNVDFIIYPRNGPIRAMPLTSPNADPMIYPLLFPYGEKGWENKLPLTKVPNKRTYVTLLQYYSYRLAIRPGFSIIHSAGKLFQQYIVDAYVKVESSRLLWIKQNQHTLRVENYKALSDHMTTGTSEFPPGKVIILPSTFIGSPRNMRQNYLDALAIVGQYGKPDYFITFTCNPRWREITETVKPWEKVEHRPDLVARVFSLKLKELLKDLLKKHVFGVVLAYVYVIEFQKRGLPHAHILLIVRNQDRLRDRTQIDKVISAEIPENNALLYDIIKTNMVHGPCGAINPKSPCMSNGECTKKYPKAFCSETVENVNGYVQYKRRNNGTTIPGKGVDIDNRWIVPYSPYLSLKYNAHINVESCASIKSVKYLFKYIYKGHDCINLEMSNNNEVEKFVNCRYVSAPEAAWRLFEYKMYDMSHTIYRLAIHLPNEQQVYFTEGTEQTTLERARTTHTTLTAWFYLNETNLNARQYLYTEIPKHFVFTKEKQWTERQRGSQSIIGRMYFANPTDLERFYLRLLLLRVKGATCFDDLKTHERNTYNTFHEAALARGLLDSDEEWKNCLTEAIACHMPSQIRFLFSLICIFCRPANVNELWEMFKDSLMEDFTKTNTKEASMNLALCDIQNNLILHSLKCSDFNLPNPHTNITTYLDSVPYNVEEEAKCGEKMYNNFNAEQAKIVDDVLAAIYDNSPNKLFFVDGPGGTGKTYLYSVLLHIVRGKGDTAEAVAWTGIAAGLLQGGRTAHSRFKLPVPILENSTSTMRPTSKDAEHLRTVKLFIWDEAPMAPKYALEVVDKLLRDITKRNEPFGGKVFVLGGDFRQVTPIVPRGGRCASVEMCLKHSTLWPLFNKKYLTKNMRSDEHEQMFADFLLHIGNGTMPTEPDLELNLIKIPEDCVTTDCLVDAIYGNILNCTDTTVCASTAILCPTNNACSSINEQVINKLTGECYDYYSIDSIECEDQSDCEHYTTEFLNSLTPSGMPPHHLRLKINAVIILLRNLNIKKGLCNGVRLIVKQLFTNFIEAEILTGQMSGNVVFLPRIFLSPSDTGLPFQLKRKQIPIRLAFAITINKAQGQTFNKLGIYLPEPVFSHGQLYVAFSRVRKISNLKIKIENNNEQGQFKGKVGTFTKNIVYNEVLDL